MNWDYETHPNHGQLGIKCTSLVQAVMANPPTITTPHVDMREFHRTLFDGMAPQACSCFAGTFRGDPSCVHLENYECGIPGSIPRVGIPARQVQAEMLKFHHSAANDLNSLEEFIQRCSDEALKIKAIAVLLAQILQEFLTIHPFANGNGHASRFMIACQIIRFGYWKGNWPVEEAPAYHAALQLHRQKNPGWLEALIMMALNGEALP